MNLINNDNKNSFVTYAICFLTTKLSEEYYQFCKSLFCPQLYTIYICVDKPTHYESDSFVEIININAFTCQQAGFKGSVTYFSENAACSRDKALYYFCRVSDKSHPKIWFIEEDVFFYSLETIKRLDSKYPFADLLSRSHNIKSNTKVDWQHKWHWPRILRQTRLPPPYATSMICAIRVSSKFMKQLDRYVRVAHALFVDEALFNSISLHAKLIIRTPCELSSIIFRKQWKKDEINTVNLYHPIKNFHTQIELRKHLNQQNQTSKTIIEEELPVNFKNKKIYHPKQQNQQQKQQHQLLLRKKFFVQRAIKTF